MTTTAAPAPRRLNDVPEYRQAEERYKTLLAELADLRQLLAETDSQLAEAKATHGIELDAETASLIEGTPIAEARTPFADLTRQRDEIERKVQRHARAIAELHNGLYGQPGAEQMRSASPQGAMVFPRATGPAGSIRNTAARQVSDAYAPELLSTAAELARVLRQAAALNGRLRLMMGELREQQADADFVSRYCYPVCRILGEMQWPGGPTAAEAAEAAQRGEAKAEAVERYAAELRRAGVEID